MNIKSPKDFLAGLMFMGIGVAFAGAATIAMLLPAAALLLVMVLPAIFNGGERGANAR